MRPWSFLLCLILGVLSVGPQVATATVTETTRDVSAARRTGAVVLDGRLLEPGWQAVEATGGFWQREPNEGASPSQPTEFRVLYDDDALYIGVRAHDSDPDQIRGLLTRRDEASSSDWILVGIDSYNDNRTSFTFGLNPAGVQRDYLIYDDVTEDASWDAVWSGAARVDERGWVAEFRIPYSQLRFSNGKEQHWGLQVSRVVQRSSEVSTWSPAPRAKPQNVSFYGELDGIRGIKPPKRLEVLPYMVGGLRVADVASANPYTDTAEPEFGFGLDARYGLTTDLTLSATVNPDFGQVEADPSQVNLTANEIFLQEKRPFFVEGGDIFRFGLSQGDSAVEQLFYSRRIGAAPSLSAGGQFVDQDPTTTILGATKISGKTQGGWSIGALSVVTDEEVARVQTESGEKGEQVVEPLTNYSVLRLRKDLNDGRTTVGLAGTGVHRALGDTGLDFLHKRAYGGGLEFAHRNADGDWSADAKVMASSVHGSTEAIGQTQLASQRYFQRPDASHVRFDPNRTSLSGLGFMGSIANSSHKHLRGAIGVDARSPGLEVNDLGFQHRADYLINWAWLQFRDDEPGDVLQQFQVNTNIWSGTDWAPQLTSTGGNVNFWTSFVNRWNLSAGVNLNLDRLDTRLLRGGPAVRGLPHYGSWLGVSTDSRKRIGVDVNTSWWQQPASDSWTLAGNVGLSIQARDNLDLSIGAQVNRSANDKQYVGQFVDPKDNPRYLLARINQTTIGATVRANYTFSPRLSMQLYAQPFGSTGRYRDYKEPGDVRAKRYEDRFSELTADEMAEEGNGLVVVDRNGDGVTDYRFERGDFRFVEFQSTLVLRWEYLPGSTLFAIWNHNRDASDTNTRLWGGVGPLGDAAGEHVALLKLTYRWGA